MPAITSGQTSFSDFENDVKILFSERPIDIISAADGAVAISVPHTSENI